jgi:hypothetical protein
MHCITSPAEELEFDGTRAVDWHRHFLNYFNLEHPSWYRRILTSSKLQGRLRPRTESHLPIFPPGGTERR